MMKKVFEEQRKSKRVPLNIRVDYACSDNYLFEYSSNLSAHGIFIKTDAPLDPGTKLTLHFSINEGKDEIKTKGEVIWINRPSNGRENQGGMGVKFTNLSVESESKLRNLVKRIAVLKGVLDENM